ncbi:uncharacterized protein [Amphiura filiformis]|uniref:uncharacterized protein n=1 Tax=Amphiura filiformis TaxID=82378 RepID=UPI003B22754A
MQAFQYQAVFYQQLLTPTCVFLMWEAPPRRGPLCPYNSYTTARLPTTPVGAKKRATEEVLTSSKLSTTFPLLHQSTIQQLCPSTPIQVDSFEHMLQSHPDQILVNNVCDGLRNGVDIGFRGLRTALRTPNMRSAFDNPEVIRATIQKELESGWSVGPFDSPPLPDFVVNSIGVVPKKSGTFRMITDLSRPEEGVNHAICKDDYSLEYAGVDDATAILSHVGPDAYMCKLDIKDAFRLIPVRCEDWPLLGYEWEGEYFFHTRLPFGLRSSPFHFTQFSSLLAWIAGHQSQHSIIPGKLEGPTPIITFLGIELNAPHQSLSLPPEKLQQLQQELSEWDPNRKKCTKRDLLSLIGKLSFASKCIPAGRIFFRRLIDLSMKAQKLHHRLDLTIEARQDIAWWARFLPEWNGTARFIEPTWTPADSLQLFTDAAASVGAGAYFMGRWFFIPWSQEIKDNESIHITWMELFPIVVAARVWGSAWFGKRVLFHTDNRAVVDIWYKQSSRAPLVMSLVRKLFLTAAQYNFHVAMTHIPGHTNTFADLISRNLQAQFHIVAPEADQDPILIPASMTADLFRNT